MAEEISEGKWCRRRSVESLGEKGSRKRFDESYEERQSSGVAKRDGGKWQRREIEENGGRCNRIAEEISEGRWCRRGEGRWKRVRKRV